MGDLHVEDRGFEGFTSLIHSSIPRMRLPRGEDCFHGCPKFHAAHDLIYDPIPRFESLPMHNLCYHQVYCPLLSVFHKVSNMYGHKASLVAKTDRLGMTPFHIMALSSRPDQAFFECLVKSSANGGQFGQYPLDYLFRNPSTESGKSISYLTKLLVNDRIESLNLK